MKTARIGLVAYNPANGTVEQTTMSYMRSEIAREIVRECADFGLNVQVEHFIALKRDQIRDCKYDAFVSHCDFIIVLKLSQRKRSYCLSTDPLILSCHVDRSDFTFLLSDYLKFFEVSHMHHIENNLQDVEFVKAGVVPFQMTLGHWATPEDLPVIEARTPRIAKALGRAFTQFLAPIPPTNEQQSPRQQQGHGAF